MVVTVEASLSQHGVYFAGEKFTCRVQLKCDSNKENDIENILEVGLIQLQGYAYVDKMVTIIITKKKNKNKNFLFYFVILFSFHSFGCLELILLFFFFLFQ